jgi:hypothetical protein
MLDKMNESISINFQNDRDLGSLSAGQIKYKISFNFIIVITSTKRGAIKPIILRYIKII